MNPDEVLSFLVKAWSEDKETIVYRGSWFGADVKHRYVVLPSYYQEIPYEVELDLTDIKRWRFYRFCTWHEAQHLRFSLDKEAIFDEFYDQMHTLKDAKLLLIKNLIEIFEDYRIEKLGLRDYKYSQEQEFMKEVGRAGMNLILENPAVMNEKLKLNPSDIDSHLQLNEMMGILLFDYEFEERNEWRDLVYKVKEIMTEIETVDDLKEAVMKSYNILRDAWIEPEYKSELANLLVLIMNQGLVNKGIKEVELPESIVLEFEEIKKDIEEYKQVLLVLQKMAGSMKGRVQDQLGDWSLIYEPVKTEAEILKNNLMKWQVGWIETISHIGDDIEPESFLISRVYEKHEKPKFFIDERQLVPRGKFLILIDMSASISDYADLYRAAIAVITSAMDYVGIDFALTSFSGSQISAIKDITTPFDSMTKSRIAGLIPDGGTPLGFVLNRISDYLSRIDKLIIITDGMPNDPEYAYKMIERIRQDGKKVGVLLLSDVRIEAQNPFIEYLTRIPNSFTFTHNICELPTQFFKLLNYMR